MKQKRYKFTKQGAKEVSLKNKLIERKREIVIAIIVIMAITIFALISKYKNNQVIEEEIPNIGIVDVDQYTSLQQLLISYGCVYYNDFDENGIHNIELKFKYSLYDNGVSKEDFYMDLIAAVAEFLEYKSFIMNDAQKIVKVEVKCSMNEIKEIIINGDPNFYENMDSQIALAQRNKVIDEFSITSNDINNLIKENWVSKQVNLGTRDSYFDKYHIYFDEGIKARVISQRIYNIIFTDRYSKTIVNDLTVKSSEDEIKKSLGEPTFKSEDSLLLGYVNDKIYVFFDLRNKQVSVYRVEEYDSTAFMELVNKYNNGMSLKEFGNELTYLWDDYDSYDYNSEGMEIVYSLRGVKISFFNNNRMRDLKNGINLYNNYYGKVSKEVYIDEISNIAIDVEKNTYFNDIDLVFETENKRSEIYKRLSEKENYDSKMDQFVAITQASYGTTFDYSYKATTDDMYNDEIDDIWKEMTQTTEENNRENNEGYNYDEDFPTYGLKFISKNNSYPDVEIREDMEISSFLWYNKDRIVFSVNFDGIYVFDCISQKKTRILENTDSEVFLNHIVDNEITYNNNKTVTLELE